VALFVSLFLAGLITILLPCILPLVPIVLGVSIAGKHRLRPLITIIGMLISFVGVTFILQVALSQFVTLADVIRISTYYVTGTGLFSYTKELRFPEKFQEYYDTSLVGEHFAEDWHLDSVNQYFFYNELFKVSFKK
jgi:cytochrome c biogenesis protein CcdA